MAIVEEVRFDGVQVATAQLGQLAHVLIEAQQATGQVRTAADAAAREARDLAAAHNEAERSTRELGQQFTQIPARIAGVANAIQSLAQRIGGGSLGTTAGLVGSMAQTIAQGAQMGIAFGPGGALVGAIGGAATEAFITLAAAVDGATRAQHDFEAASQRAASFASDITRQVQARAAISRSVEHASTGDLGQEQAVQMLIEQRQLVHELDEANRQYNEEAAGFVGSLTESEADRANHQREYERQRIEALGNIRTLEEAVGVAAQHSAEETEQIVQRTQQQIEFVNRRAEEQARQRARAAQQARESALDQRASGADSGLSGARAALDALEHGGAQNEQLRDQIAHIETAYTNAWNAAYDGASNYHDLLGQLMEQVDALRETEDNAAASLHEQQEQASHDLEERARLLSKTKEEARRQDADLDQERHRRIAQAQQDADRLKAREQQEAQQRVQQGQQATQQVIGDLTNVFTLMAEGQTTAAQSMELLLAGFLQYISQRATIEALAQVAQGIGSYPDFGGMALHFAAAAAWGAVAVATGVGGAALASDAQSRGAAAQSQAQQQPASPQHKDDSGGKGGNVTYVTNFNSPVVTAATESQLGRTINRLGDRAAQRYPGG